MTYAVLFAPAVETRPRTGVAVSACGVNGSAADIRDLLKQAATLGR